MAWINALFALLVNAVPLYGVKFLGWSATTIVVLYWFENLLTAIFTCVRIVAHRAMTRKRGHWRGGQLGSDIKINDKPFKASSLLQEYAILAFVFTLAHGVFVGGFMLIFAQNHGDEPLWQFSADQFRQGVLTIFAVMVAELIVDLTGMRSRSFAWMRAYVQQRMGRVFVMHLTLIFGMVAMAATQSPFAVLYVLIGLKTLWDLAAATRSAKANANTRPDEPPVRPLKVPDTATKKQDGATATRKDGKVSGERARQLAIEDELPMP